MDYLSQQVGIIFEILPGNIGDVDVKTGHDTSVPGKSNKNAGCYQTIYDAIPVIKSLCSGIEEDISSQNIFLFWSESMETLDHLLRDSALEREVLIVFQTFSSRAHPEIRNTNPAISR